MTGQRQTLPPPAALKPGDRPIRRSTSSSSDERKEDATGIARQRRSQRLPTAREPDLQARLLELATRDRSCCWGRGGGSFHSRRRGHRSGTLAERLFLRRFLRALAPIGLDLSLDSGAGLLLVLLF